MSGYARIKTSAGAANAEAALTRPTKRNVERLMLDDRTRDEDVDQACARLREVLLQTRGVGRREFLRALATAAAGSALLAPLAAIGPDIAQAAEPPVTYF